MIAKMELGWPYPKRVAYLGEQEKVAKEHYRVEFMGQTMSLAIIRVPIQLPKYRLLNGRTASLQREWLAQHSDESPQFFTVDPESDRVQEIQHLLLQKLVGGAHLSNHFKDPTNKQLEPLILDSRGFVINGNRRLCCWRDLYASDQTKFPHFSHVDVVVLPPADEEAIDRLEARLQIEPDIKDDYSWHAKANMLLDRQQLHKLTTKDLARIYNMSEPAVKLIFEMREYAVQYLKSRGKENLWSLVTENEYAFEKMVEKRKLISATSDKRLYEEAAFAMIDDPTDGRLYQTVQDLQSHLGKVKTKLKEAFPIKPGPTVEASSQPPTEDFFGPTSSDATHSSGSDLSLVNEIAKPENRSRATEIITEVIASEKALDKDRDSAEFVFERLKRINADVQEVINSIGPDSSKSGVRAQIGQVQAGLTRIVVWLDGTSS
jgi:hypothetical protein